MPGTPQGGKMNPACLAKSSKCNSQCQNFTQSLRDPCHPHNLSYPRPRLRLLSPKLNRQCLPLLYISWAKSASTHTSTPTSFIETHRHSACPAQEAFKDQISSHLHTNCMPLCRSWFYHIFAPFQQCWSTRLLMQMGENKLRADNVLAQMTCCLHLFRLL